MTFAGLLPQERSLSSVVSFACSYRVHTRPSIDLFPFHVSFLTAAASVHSVCLTPKVDSSKCGDENGQRLDELATATAAVRLASILLACTLAGLAMHLTP